MNKDDHDVLIRVDANLKNLIDLVEHHRKDFKTHLENDTANFKAVGVSMQEIEDKINANHGEIDRKINRNHNWVMRIILPASGAVSLALILLNLFK